MSLVEMSNRGASREARELSWLRTFFHISRLAVRSYHRKLVWGGLWLAVRSFCSTRFRCKGEYILKSATQATGAGDFMSILGKEQEKKPTWETEDLAVLSGREKGVMDSFFLWYNQGIRSDKSQDNKDRKTAISSTWQRHGKGYK